MKSLKYWVVMLSLAIVSCDSDISSQLDDMAGVWKLTEMRYTDPKGASRTISESSTTLSFTKEIAGGANVDGVRYGIQDTGEEEFRFQYSVDFSQDKIDILFEDASAKEELQLDAIGRNQVYTFEQINKNQIVISEEVEVNRDKVDAEVLTNVRYVLVRR